LFAIENTPIEKLRSLSTDVKSHTGGVVIFEGLVRDINDGKKVKSLEYQAYNEMALKVGAQIMKEAMGKFDIIDAKCIHRTGHLQIGEMAVYVYSCSVHREQSFLATQYIIDEVKTRVPIWKCEHYVDGEPEWVACHKCGEHTHN
jgi:molybdopterin synthase catalytic subunit